MSVQVNEETMNEACAFGISVPLLRVKLKKCLVVQVVGALQRWKDDVNMLILERTMAFRNCIIGRCLTFRASLRCCWKYSVRWV